MGCKQSKLIRSQRPTATPAVHSTSTAENAPLQVTLSEQRTAEEQHRADDVAPPVVETVTPTVQQRANSDAEVAVLPAQQDQSESFASETAQGCTEETSLATEAESSAAVVSQASPLAQRRCNEANIGEVQGSTAVPATCFSDYLAQRAVAKGKKVLFDAETMRKTAPHGHQPAAAAANLTRKQKDMVKKKHVSTGRRGPVASKWDKGGRAHMQTELYLEMAAAFERMLTNAETINAHLDSR